MKPALDEREQPIEMESEADRELRKTLRRVRRDLRLFLTDEELRTLFKEQES